MPLTIKKTPLLSGHTARVLIVRHALEPLVGWFYQCVLLFFPSGFVFVKLGLWVCACMHVRDTQRKIIYDLQNTHKKILPCNIIEILPYPNHLLYLKYVILP